jgi:Fe-Mn family superoxide dismutase
LRETPACASGLRSGKTHGISEKLIRSHHENNYTGAVKALNVVEQRLAALSKDKDLPPYLYGDLKRQELIRTGSVVLHEKYLATSAATARLTAPQGSSLRNGSVVTRHGRLNSNGPAIHVRAGRAGRYLPQSAYGRVHNYWSSDHTSNPPFSVPLLVLDMYEHAYQMDYGAAAAKYIDAFMLNVDWEHVTGASRH